MIDQHLHDIFNLAQTEDRRTLYLTQTAGQIVNLYVTIGRTNYTHSSF